MNRFCHECGVAVSDTNRFCNKCGARLLPTQPSPRDGGVEGQPHSPSAAAPSSFDPAQDPAQERTAPLPGTWPAGRGPGTAPSPPVPGQMTTGELTPNIAGMLCYPLSFVTGVLFLILAPYNRNGFVRFHAYQSIFFCVGIILLNIMLGIVTIILPSFLEAMMWTGLRALALGGSVWLMYQAYLGNRFALPIIGELADNQSRKP